MSWLQFVTGNSTKIIIMNSDGAICKWEYIIMHNKVYSYDNVQSVKSRRMLSTPVNHFTSIRPRTRDINAFLISYLLCRLIIHKNKYNIDDCHMWWSMFKCIIYKVGDLLAFGVEHFHEEGLRGRLSRAVPLVQVVLPSRGQRVDLGNNHYEFPEFILEMIYNIFTFIFVSPLFLIKYIKKSVDLSLRQIAWYY